MFAVTLAEVSLIEFVNPESSRQRLKEAEDQIRSGDTLGALDNIALAFTEMISDYEDRKRTQFDDSPFYFGRSMTFLTSFQLGLNRSSSLHLERKLVDFVDEVTASIEAMQEAMKMLALGIEYRRYSKFKQLTPDLSGVMGGDTICQRRFEESEKPSQEDARFCIDFVIESALALAEFDYTVNVSK
jgi:hypothetical protein